MKVLWLALLVLLYAGVSQGQDPLATTLLALGNILGAVTTVPAAGTINPLPAAVGASGVVAAAGLVKGFMKWALLKPLEVTNLILALIGVILIGVVLGLGKKMEDLVPAGEDPIVEAVSYLNPGYEPPAGGDTSYAKRREYRIPLQDTTAFQHLTHNVQKSINKQY